MKKRVIRLTQERACSSRRGMSLRRNDGVSIIEIVIAIMIFSVGILGMASMQANATGSNRGSIKLSSATEKAVAVLEELTSLSNNHPSLAAGPHTPAQTADWIDNDDNGQVDETGESGDYSVSWTVFQNAVIPNTRTISVTVRSGSSNKSVNLAGVK